LPEAAQAAIIRFDRQAAKIAKQLRQVGLNALAGTLGVLGVLGGRMNSAWGAC